MPYLGNEPATAFTSTTKDTFSGDASTTDFTMSKAANVNAVRVVVENVVQNPTVAYTCSGTTLSFTSAPPTGTNNIYVVHLGPPAATIAPPTTINNATTFTGGVTFKNESPEDTDGGRESILTFKGVQSGEEESTLAQIQASHDGTSDDQKGDLIFKTNDGSDGASPTEAMRIDSNGNVGIGVVSEAWNAAFPSVLQIGAGMALTTSGGDNARILGNVYYDGAYKRITSGFAHQYEQTGGTHRWAYAATGAADSAISFSEAMRIDTDGKVMVGKTSDDNSVDGVLFDPAGMVKTARASSICAIHNRRSSDGEIMQFRKDDATAGIIGSVNTSSASRIFIANVNTGFHFNGSTQQIIPCNGTGAKNDNAIALGNASGRFTQLFATNSSINTSDENEKQNIASLTTAEITAATAISKLFKTYKWKDAVTAKGDDARTHTGVVAQQVQTAMSDAGLDASKYAFWCSDTWWEKDVEVAAVEAVEAKDAVYDDDGKLVSEAVEAVEAKDAYTRTDTYDTQEEAPEGATERTRMGVRYPELLAFISAATEQRLTSIEARLTALEAG
jgi:hypothetical protein